MKREDKPMSAGNRALSMVGLGAVALGISWVAMTGAAEHEDIVRLALMDPPEPPPTPDPDAVPPGDYEYPAVPGLENLTPENLDVKIAFFKAREEDVTALLAKFRLVATPDDPDLKNLEDALRYYQDMQAELAKLHGAPIQGTPAGENPHPAGTVEHAKWLLDHNAPVDDVKMADDLLHKKLEAIRSGNGTTILPADQAAVWNEYLDAERFFSYAKPGTLIATDVKTGERIWYPLNGIPGQMVIVEGDPTRTPTDQPILFKDKALNELPVTTVRAFYDYCTEVHDGFAVVKVTEGYGLTADHISEAHRLGLAVDFVPKDGDFSAPNIARFIGEHGGQFPSYTYYELPGSTSDAELLKVRNEVVEALKAQGMSEARAHQVVFGDGKPTSGFVRRIDGATGKHFHWEIVGEQRKDTRLEVIPLAR